jgi:hypothetical protein
MRVHKLTFPPSALAAMPEAHRSDLLQLGLFLNDANWMRKLLLICSLDESEEEPEERARFALTASVAKMLAGKMHEGWLKMTSRPLADAIATVSVPARTVALRDQLAASLAQESLIHRVRRGHAAHYPSGLSLDGLPNIAQGDAAIYFSNHAGDTLSLISELSAAAEWIALGGYQDVVEAVQAISNELVRVVGLYEN